MMDFSQLLTLTVTTGRKAEHMQMNHFEFSHESSYKQWGIRSTTHMEKTPEGSACQRKVPNC